MEIKKEVKYEVTIIAAFMLLALFLYFYTSPSLTGNVIVSTSTNITFDNPSDYTYNSSLIEIANGDVSLILQEVTGEWVTYNYSVFGVEKAYYDYSNRTSYVTGLNDSRYKFDDNELFEITFSDFLENGDIIDLHVDDEDDESTIYLCKSTTICSTSNYGSVYHNGTKGIFSITVQNLPNSTKSFTLISDEDVDLDFINSSKGPVINAMTEPYDQTSLLTSKDGNDFDIKANHINEYLDAITAENEKVTAKDFRTWAATWKTASRLSKQLDPDTPTARKRIANEVIKTVASDLGNTPTVCRSSYIHPTILIDWTDGKFRTRWNRATRCRKVRGLSKEETVTLLYLK